MRVHAAILLTPSFEISLHVAIVGCCHQLFDVLGTHISTATIERLDLNLFLSTYLIDFLILSLDVFKLHILHLYDECAAILTPKIECCLELAAVELDQLYLEIAIALHSLALRRLLPLVEVLAQKAPEDSDEGGGGTLGLRAAVSSVDAAHLRVEHLNSGLGLHRELICDIDEFLVLLVLSESVEALLFDVLVRLDLEA